MRLAIHFHSAQRLNLGTYSKLQAKHANQPIATYNSTGYLQVLWLNMIQQSIFQCWNKGLGTQAPKSKTFIHKKNAFQCGYLLHNWYFCFLTLCTQNNSSIICNVPTIWIHNLTKYCTMRLVHVYEQRVSWAQVCGLVWKWTLGLSYIYRAYEGKRKVRINGREANWKENKRTASSSQFADDSPYYQ